MGPSSARVRSGRSAPLVAVTAAGSPAGRAIVVGLARRIGRPGGPRAVLAIDSDPPDSGVPDNGVVAVDHQVASSSPVEHLDGVRRCSADLTTAAVRAALAGVDVVVHVVCPSDGVAEARVLATARRARAVRSVLQVAQAAAAEGAHRLLVVTSAMVYGAEPGRSEPVTEDAPLAARRDEGVVGDLLEVERIVARIPHVHPELRTTVVRPAALVGPGVDTTITRHLREPWLLALRGEQMRWQFCHVDDLADAVAVALAEELDGVLTVGTLPTLINDDVERLTGMRRMELPAQLAYATAERLRRSRALGTGGADLTYVVHPWVVGAERLRAAGWRPRHDAASCLFQVREPAVAQDPVGQPGARRVEPREAALGAAGAAVAILGTAALLRQARSRRTRRGRPRL